MVACFYACAFLIACIGEVIIWHLCCVQMHLPCGMSDKLGEFSTIRYSVFIAAESFGSVYNQGSYLIYDLF